MRDFTIWEPGQSLICVLCERERGGQDPPGNWQRHYGTHRRRIPILGPHGAVLGHMVYVAR